MISALKYLSDVQLDVETKKKAQDERMANLEVLHCLKEVDSRKLYLKLGYSSLFKYVVSELKYSEDAANRRIKSMRLIKDIPEVEDKLASGSLSLTNASQIQRFFEIEKKENGQVDKDVKWDLIESLENKPVRDVQKRISKLKSKCRT